MKNDPVNHPSHYTSGKYEVIDFIEDKLLGFHVGNTVKYICRAGKKDPSKYKEDLEKSLWYLKRLLKENIPFEAVIGEIAFDEFIEDQKLSPLLAKAMLKLEEAIYSRDNRDFDLANKNLVLMMGYIVNEIEK